MIDTDIVDFITHWEGIGLWFAPIDASNSEVEQNVMILVKWIETFPRPFTIDGVLNVDIVEYFSIECQHNVVLIPIHGPDMEFLSPVRVFLKKMVVMYPFGVPNGIESPVASPGRIGKDMGLPIDMIVFHDVDFSI